MIRDVKKEKINTLAADLELINNLWILKCIMDIAMIFNTILHNEIRNHIKLKSQLKKKVRIHFFFLFEAMILRLYSSWRHQNLGTHFNESQFIRHLAKSRKNVLVESVSFSPFLSTGKVQLA